MKLYFSPQSVDFQAWHIGVFALQTPMGAPVPSGRVSGEGKGPSRLACRALDRSLSSSPQRAGQVLLRLDDGVIRALALT